MDRPYSSEDVVFTINGEPVDWRPISPEEFDRLHTCGPTPPEDDKPKPSPDIIRKPTFG